MGGHSTFNRWEAIFHMTKSGKESTRACFGTNRCLPLLEGKKTWRAKEKVVLNFRLQGLMY
jgi:hypothetical protein